MKYVVDILTPACASLESDNLKGERRWERQAARALLDAGRQVGSARPNIWARPDVPNWTGHVDNLTGHTLITQADPGSVRYRPGASFFLTNVFCGLTDAAEAEIRRAIAEMGRERVFLTHSFQLNVALKRLPGDLHDRIRWLPVPAVPSVHWDADPFTNKLFLWSARAISFKLIRPLQTIIDLLDWIRGCLKEDPELRFEVMAAEDNLQQPADAERYVWSFPVFEQAFRDVRSQVKIHPSLPWDEVQRIVARAKLIVNDPTAFGGPPIEAASYGIPVVGTNFSSFHTTDPATARWPGAVDAGMVWPAFKEFVCVNGTALGWGGASSVTTGYPLTDHLDLWHRDPDAYRKAGAGYRQFVHDTYTYDVFVKKLDEMIAPQ